MGRLLNRNKATALMVVLVGVAAGAPIVHAAGGPPLTLNFGKSPQLLPTLHATQVLDAADVQDGRQYDYSVKGYFKIAGKTVARLPTFTGHVTATRQHSRLREKASTQPTNGRPRLPSS